jgi:hypothetical protein
MSAIQLHRPPQPSHDVPDPRDPPTLPVEPDQGPVPDRIPDDPEHDRVIDPANGESLPRLQAEPARGSARKKRSISVDASGPLASV